MEKSHFSNALVSTPPPKTKFSTELFLALHGRATIIDCPNRDPFQNEKGTLLTLTPAIPSPCFGGMEGVRSPEKCGNHLQTAKRMRAHKCRV